MEIYKDIKGYEGSYQVSNLGNVRSLDRINSKNSKIKGRILKLANNGSNYLKVGLYEDGKGKGIYVHQLVAIAFLNHIPNGFTIVVDHINHNTKDNRVENLRLVTHRKNVSHRKKKYTSKYAGVNWSKEANKWRARILIGEKRKTLGSFVCEIEASEAYKTALNNLNNLNK